VTDAYEAALLAWLDEQGANIKRLETIIET
jgi:hypothetical protein